MTTPVSPLDCLCTGLLVADHICEPIQRLPEPGELIVTPRMELSVGGCGANVAVDLARLGRRTAIAGAVGDDIFGEFLSKSLQRAGVDTSPLAVIPDCDSSGSLVINSAGEDRRFIHSVGANAHFTGTSIDPALLQAAKVVYLGGYLLCPELTAASVRQMFETARQAGAITVLDVVLSGPGDYRPQLETVLPVTDVFLPNNDEARLLTGLDDPVEQARFLQQLGAQTVIITCGESGSVTAHPGGLLHAARFEVPLVDGTGSGDAFAAGFIHGLIDNLPLADCLHRGAALGASVVTRAGATTGALTRPELDDFLASHPLQAKPL